MPVNIRKAGNVVNIDLGVNDVNSYELAAVANSFSFNSTTSVVKSRFFQNWGLSVPLNQLIIDGVVPANEAAFNAALATLSTVTTSGGGGGTPGGAVNSIQYNNGGAFGGLGFGNAGEVLTSNGNAVAPSFQAGGSAPILPSTYIGVGDGVNPYTGYADFVYDVAGEFSVGFFTNPYLYINPNTGIQKFGDINGVVNLVYIEVDAGQQFINLEARAAISIGDPIANGNNTFVKQDDASQTLTYQKGSDVYWSTNIATPAGFWGSPAGNATSVAWDDAIPSITLTATSLFLKTSGFGGATNGDVLSLVDNTTGETAWVTGGGPSIGAAISGGTANRILFEDAANLLAEYDAFQFVPDDNFSVIFTGGNDTRFIDDDVNQKLSYGVGVINWFELDIVNNSGFFQNPISGEGFAFFNKNASVTAALATGTGNGGDVNIYTGAGGGTSGNGGVLSFFSGIAPTNGNGGDIVFTLGAGAGGGTNGNFSINAAQTITLTAANGVGINGSPISVAALDIQSTTAALRVPIQTTAQRTAITTTNIPGLIVFDSDLNALMFTINNGNWVQA